MKKYQEIATGKLIEAESYTIEHVEQTGKFDGRLGSFQIPMQDYQTKEMEIIGNIFEHPDLLNSKQ